VPASLFQKIVNLLERPIGHDFNCSPLKYVPCSFSIFATVLTSLWCYSECFTVSTETPKNWLWKWQDSSEIY